MRISSLLSLVVIVPVLGAAESWAQPYADDAKIVETIRGIPDNTSVELPKYKVEGQEAEQWQKIYGGAPGRPALSAKTLVCS